MGSVKRLEDILIVWRNGNEGRIERLNQTDLKGQFSGHSLRVGSAQSMATRGASLVEMQTDGRWTSPTMPGRYSRG